MGMPMWRVFRSDRSRRHTSKPDSFGIIISSRMRSGFQSRAAGVSSPLAAIFVSNPLPVEVGFEQVRVRRVIVGDQDALGSSGIVAAAVIICTARAILNPKHDNHSPPCEVEERRGNSLLRNTAAGGHRTRARGRRRVSRSRNLRSRARSARGRPRSCLHRLFAETSAELRRARTVPPDHGPPSSPMAPNPAPGERSLRGRFASIRTRPFWAAPLPRRSVGIRGAARRRTHRPGAEQHAYVLTRPPATTRARSLRRLLLLQQRRSRCRARPLRWEGRCG